jgi:aspartate-semialdehyde dehydrogenase
VPPALSVSGAFSFPFHSLRRTCPLTIVSTSFIELLATHPYFEIHALGASARSAGKEYAQVTKWKLSTPVPESVRKMVVQECVPEPFKECGVVFSGLDHDVAGEIGE